VESIEILTPDQRLRVFVSSTLNELAEERLAARRAIERLCLAPVMFELGARPYAPRSLYLAYLRQSHVFVGIYGEQYGWIAPDMEISGLEDEVRHATDLPLLLYIKSHAPARDRRLTAMLNDVADSVGVSYKTYSSAREFESLLAGDLAVLLTERFTSSRAELVNDRVPRPVSEFVGRGSELAELVDLVTSDNVRLVTLTGPGGIGKTRLGIEVAHAVADNFPDGTVFVPLAARGADGFMEAVSPALGLKDLGQQPLMEMVFEYLRHRRMLLVLDNFEHMLADAAVVSHLLEQCPDVRILVTSRVALRLTGEEEFPVPPLGIPRVTQRVEEVLRAEAAQLFCRRVAAVRHGYALTSRDAAVVARICRRLDGLPLALELVAARASVLSVDELGTRLDTVLDLSAPAPDVPARQRTLRQTMDWSFQQLPPTARTLFAQLGVFVGSFPLSAVEAVCEVDGDMDLLDELAILVNHSLLRPQMNAGAVRFSMLEITRQYALSHLNTSEAEQTCERHAQHFRAYASAKFEELRGTNQQEELLRLGLDIPDMGAAVNWLVAHGRRSEAADICWSMWSFQWLRGTLSEGRRWIQETLAAEGLLLPSPRARLLAADAYLASWQRDFDAAGAEALEALELAQATDDDEVLTLVHLLLLHVFGSTGDETRARKSAAEAIRLARARDDRWAEAFALTVLCLLEAATGHFEGNEEAFEQALTIARETQDWLVPALALIALAELRLWQGRTPEGAALLSQSLALFAEIRMAMVGTSCLHSTAVLLGRLGDWTTAVRLQAAADAMLDGMHATLPPVWVPRRDRLLADAREQLGVSTYDEASAEGSTWTFDDAAAVASVALAHVADLAASSVRSTSTKVRP
jgi:predicted ATPase